MRVQSSRNSNRNKRTKVALVAVFVIILGIFLPKIFSIIGNAVFYPVHLVNVWVEESSSLVPSMIRDRNHLLSEVKRLENELVIAGRLNTTQSRLETENNRLRSLLGSADEDRVLTAVIGRPGELPYDLIQIDQGSQSGIEVGSPVFIGSDIVVGLVVHVAPKYSFVQLFTHPGFEATAFIEGPDVVSVIEGFGGGVARVRVPQGVPLSVGNLVMIPSINPGVFGRISYVENGPTQPEQYGYITPDIPISGMYLLAVGKQSQIARSADEIDQSVLGIMKSRLLFEEVNTVSDLATSTATNTSSGGGD